MKDNIGGGAAGSQGKHSRTGASHFIHLKSTLVKRLFPTLVASLFCFILTGWIIYIGLTSQWCIEQDNSILVMGFVAAWPFAGGILNIVAYIKNW